MTKCYSVRLESFYSISPKCYKAVAFDGSEALIPSSQYYGQDWDVIKSEAHWISAWILDKKELQYSQKKWTNFSKAGKNIGQMVKRILLCDWEGAITWSRDFEFNYTKGQILFKNKQKREDRVIKKWFNALK